MIQKFHDHLDRCQQCRIHPFNLCAEGERLLEQAATGAPPSPAAHRLGVDGRLGAVERDEKGSGHGV